MTEDLSASIQVYTVNGNMDVLIRSSLIAIFLSLYFVDASSNSFLNSLVNARISPLSDISNYWSSFLPDNATSGNIVYSTDVNSQGGMRISLNLHIN